MKLVVMALVVIDCDYDFDYYMVFCYYTLLSLMVDFFLLLFY
jgi:hypothetical protein